MQNMCIFMYEFRNSLYISYIELFIQDVMHARYNYKNSMHFQKSGTAFIDWNCFRETFWNPLFFSQIKLK